MKKKYLKFAYYNTALFPTPTEDDNGGGGGGETESTETETETESNTETETETETEKPPTGPATVVDAEALAKAFGTTIAEHFPKVQAQPEPKLSPEEARKLLNDFDITDDWVKRAGDLATQKEAFAEFKKQMVTYMDTIQQVRLQQMHQQFEGRFTPVQSMLEQFQAQQAEAAFYSQYPVLNKPELRPFIVQAATNLRASGQFRDGDNSHNFKTLATQLEKTIQAINPAFKLSAATQNKSTPQPRKSGIAPTTNGQSGGGGNAGGGGTAPGTPKAISLFPKISGGA